MKPSVYSPAGYGMTEMNFIKSASVLGGALGQMEKLIAKTRDHVTTKGKEGGVWKTVWQKSRRASVGILAETKKKQSLSGEGEQVRKENN